MLPPVCLLNILPRRRGNNTKEPPLLGIILLVVLIALVLGALPVYPYSRKWGYYPGGILSLILIVLVVLMLLGRV